jgi:hypothetical protein
MMWELSSDQLPWLFDTVNPVGLNPTSHGTQSALASAATATAAVSAAGWMDALQQGSYQITVWVTDVTAESSGQQPNKQCSATLFGYDEGSSPHPSTSLPTGGQQQQSAPKKQKTSPSSSGGKRALAGEAAAAAAAAAGGDGVMFRGRSNLMFLGFGVNTSSVDSDSRWSLTDTTSPLSTTLHRGSYSHPLHAGFNH